MAVKAQGTTDIANPVNLNDPPQPLDEVERKTAHKSTETDESSGINSSGGTGGTIVELIRSNYIGFTRAERKLADALIANYPVAGLVSITEFAKSGAVSTPTVLRMIKKIGHNGFPPFQKVLREELQETLSNPIAKHERWSADAPEEHVINRFAEATFNNLSQSLKQIDYKVFDKIVALIAAKDRNVFIAGGRITHSIADYLFTHLQVVRTDVNMLPSSSSLWPHQLLNMHAGDLLVVFDIRRYEIDLYKFAELAAARDVQIVLMTDQWMSPIAALARYSINARIEVPSGWDSAVVTMFFIEALIAAVENQLWEETSHRMQELEGILNATQRFQKQP
ncbi:MAG: RpiR family transcriptional regulator [Osedax symbiont Rs1]|nr:MAG: RpiR family transcriptional regulator [Osedax symbiont Rs1]